MRTYHHRFHHQVAMDGQGVRCYLGHCQPFDQECPFSFHSGEFFIREISQHICMRNFARHSVLVSIISNSDVRFTSQFWQRFHEELGMRLHFNSVDHPQTDGQSERGIQTLKDMLRACVIDFSGSQDSYLHLAKFSYNNYHSCIGATYYEILYGRKCRIPVCWGKVGHRVMRMTEVFLQMIDII